MLEKIDIEEFPFPTDAKVRIVIGGLAYCRLKKNANSLIYFLSHAYLHKLDMQVIKRNRLTGAPIYTYPTERITYGHGISISSTKAIQPGTIYADRLEGEIDLEKMLNISDDMHDRAMTEKPLGATAPPTLLEINGCAFYTLQMAADEYEVYEVKKPGEDPKYKYDREIGYVMGGKIKCRPADEDTVTVISCLSLAGGQLLLPGIEDGVMLAYDIVLSNHCVPPVGQRCNGNETDFHYYYDVLWDPKEHERTFIIRAIKDKRKPVGDKERASDLAACNPVVIDPPDW